MTNDCYISVRDMQYSYLCNGFKIVVTTDIPSHLYMRWTTVEPQIHAIPLMLRGIYLHGDRYFCFVAYTDNEQEEAGDTYIHTYIKRNWPVCQTRYFYFWGKIAGETCQSTTAFFTLHFAIDSFNYVATPSNRTILATHALWPPCHDAAAGTILTNYDTPWYLIFAGVELVATYWIYRGFLFFDTAYIPTLPPPSDGFLSLYSFEHLRTSSATYPHLSLTKGVQNDPIIPIDYGAQLPYTDVAGQKDYATFIDGQYNNVQLNDYGISLINTTGITKFCLRAELDVKDSPPPLGTNWLKFFSSQKGPPYSPLLTLCYPPGTLG